MRQTRCPGAVSGLHRTLRIHRVQHGREVPSETLTIILEDAFAIPTRHHIRRALIIFYIPPSFIRFFAPSTCKAVRVALRVYAHGAIDSTRNPNDGGSDNDNDLQAASQQQHCPTQHHRRR